MSLGLDGPFIAGLVRHVDNIRRQVEHTCSPHKDCHGNESMLRCGHVSRCSGYTLWIPFTHQSPFLQIGPLFSLTPTLPEISPHE